MFERIKNDKEIIEIYNKVENYENENKGWAYHNYNHVLNVAQIVEKILTDLKYSHNFIEEAKIACILHDTGAIKGKENHAQRSYEYAKEYLEKNNIILKNKELVLEAIKIHSDGFDTENIVALSLILADKLDIKKTRVAEEGKKIKGMRQQQYIEDINLEINNNNLNIYFTANSKINMQELNEYYFTEKLFKAINKFSNKMNLSPKIYMNDTPWKIG